MAKKRLTEETVPARLKSKSISYVSGFVNTHKPFTCRCDVCDHVWEAWWSNVSIKGCPYCAMGRQHMPLVTPVDSVIKKLSLKGLRLLSGYTKLIDKHMLACCSCGHEWSAVLTEATTRSGCPECSRKSAGYKLRLSDDDVSSILESTHTQLLDPYVGGKHTNVYAAKCLVCGHTRSVTFATLRYHGCPACAGSLPKTEDDYTLLAKTHGGTCVSRGKNTLDSSVWECMYGHQFERSYSTITRDKTFCTVCKNSRAEEMCRMALEFKFGMPFPKARVSQDGYRKKLELDGYCPTLKVAFEHQGPHHYTITWQDKDGKKLKATLKNDRRKVAWCKDNGVALIVIPQLGIETDIANLEAIILKSVHGHPSELSIRPYPIDVDKLANTPSPINLDGHKKLQNLRHYTASYGVDLLTSRYKGVSEDYEFKCKNGHLFSVNWSAAHNLKACPLCKDSFDAITDPGIAHQRLIRDKFTDEDVCRLKNMGVDVPSSTGVFSLSVEELTVEHVEFIERYEWLGTTGSGIRWCFCARYNGLLGGVVMMSEPYRYERNETADIECLIKRGACASWTPKNLGSKLIMWACDWMVNNTQKRLFFAYADPVAGEIGTIYQACGFDYLGRFKKIVYWENGKLKNAQTSKRTSRLLPWMKKNGISVDPAWLTKKGYLRWSAIPEVLRKTLRKHVSDSSKNWFKQDLWHSKYVLFKSKSKSERIKLKAEYAFPTGPYPKRKF